MEPYLIVLLVVSLIAGMSAIYLIRYWRKAGRKIGLWKMMVVITLVMAACQAQDLPGNFSGEPGTHPIIFPPEQLLAAADAIIAVPDAWADQVTWLAGVRAFLGNDSNLTNLSMERA